MSNENGNINPNFPPTNPYGNSSPGQPQKFWGVEEKTFCMLLHLSPFANIVVPIPFLGLILPIAMWITTKDRSPMIDQHGKNFLNFMISMFIYHFVSGILWILLIGIVTTIALIVVGAIFQIIAAVKASNGEYWPYPLCIRFFK